MNLEVSFNKGEEKLQESKDEKEFVQQESAVRHTKITKEYLENDFDRYVGEKVKKILQRTTLKQMKLFESLVSSTRGAYFVKGSRKMLRRFQAYFIAKCASKAYSYATFMLKEFVEGYTENSDDDAFVAGRGKDLLFLYLHREAAGTGNTDTWMGKTALDKITNRKRKGLVTVVLSEREFPVLEGSKELKVLDLGGAEKAVDTEAAIAKINNGQANTEASN